MLGIIKGMINIERKLVFALKYPWMALINTIKAALSIKSNNALEIIKIKGNRKGRLVDMAELIDQGAKEEFEKKKTPTVHLSNDWSW